jgi:hypothetical protein
MATGCVRDCVLDAQARLPVSARRAARSAVLWNLHRACTRVRLVWADAGYAAAKLATWAAALRLTVQIVAKRDPHAFQGGGADLRLDQQAPPHHPRL